MTLAERLMQQGEQKVARHVLLMRTLLENKNRENEDNKRKKEQAEKQKEQAEKQKENLKSLLE